MIVALFASALAELARSRAEEAERRRAEADLAAALAHELLLGEDTQAGAGQRRAAGGRGAGAGARRRSSPPARLAAPDRPRSRTALAAPQRATASRWRRCSSPPICRADTEQRLRTQVVPTLEALVAIAQRRDAMQAELVETAALRRSDDIKTALLRAVSHDLRTPLTAVVAAGHALGADSLTDQERAELSAAVVEEGTRLAGLVDNLLALSRLQAGSATPRSDWVSIEDLVAAAAEGLRGEPVDVRVTRRPRRARDPRRRRPARARVRQPARERRPLRRRRARSRPRAARRRARRRGCPGQRHRPGARDRRRRAGADLRAVLPRAQRAARWRGPGSGLGLAIVKGFVEANGGSISRAVAAGPGHDLLRAAAGGRARRRRRGRRRPDRDDAHEHRVQGRAGARFSSATTSSRSSARCG